MFEDFFENNLPADEEKLVRERTEQIKAAVMERIARGTPESEEKKMKRRYLRPFVIAAAAAAVGAGSLVTADAATNGIVADTITKALTAFSGNEAEQSGAWIEVVEGEDGNVVYYTLPDGKTDSPDPETDATVSGEWTEKDTMPDEAEQSGTWIEVAESEDGNVVYYILPDDKADSPDLEGEKIVLDEWAEVKDTQPDDADDKAYYSAATIVKKDGDVVYYILPDGAKDGEDIVYDYIFSLENNDAAK